MPPKAREDEDNADFFATPKRKGHELDIIFDKYKWLIRNRLTAGASEAYIGLASKRDDRDDFRYSILDASLWALPNP